MMKMLSSRLISLVFLIGILTYGAFKKIVLVFYTKAVLGAFNTSGVSRDSLVNFLNEYNLIARVDHWHDQKIGYFIYYPTYYALHVFFIFFLANEKKVRNMLISALTLAVVGTRLIIVIGNALGYAWMANMGGQLFNILFGLPFILLSIEGGRILYKDFKKLVD